MQQPGEQSLLTLKDYFTERNIQIIDINLSQQIRESTTNYEIVVKGNWHNDELLRHVSNLSRFDFVTQTKLS